MPSHSVLRSMSDVARAISLPGESPPVRFPSFPALERTSVLRLNAPASWTLGTGTTRAMLCRQPTFPLWLDTPIAVGGIPSSYTLGWTTDTRAGSDGQLDIYTSLAYAFSGDHDGLFVNGSPTVPRVVGTTTPPCVYPVAAIDQRTTTVPYIWIPPNSFALLTIIPQLTLVPSPQAITFVVNGEIWAPGAETSGSTTRVSLIANSLGNTVVFYGRNANGMWWRPRTVDLEYGTFPAPAVLSARVFMTILSGAGGYTIQADSTTLGPQITATPATTTEPSLLPAVPPAEFTNSPIPYSSTRATAVAALFTNTTKVLNKEGTVQWGRLNPDVTNVFNFGTPTLQVLHPAEKAFLGLEQGTYCFVPPSTDQANFWDHTARVSNSAPSSNSYTELPIFRLDNTSLVACASFVDPDGATNLAINLDWHLEFRNVSALFPIGLSTMTLESFHQAQLALVAAGFFYQNESHRTILGRVLAFVKQFAPKVIAMHPMAKAAVSAYRAATADTSRGRKKGKKKKPKGPAQKGKKRSGLDMFLASNSTLKPSTAPHKPRTTSGRRSGFK